MIFLIIVSFFIKILYMIKTIIISFYLKIILIFLIFVNSYLDFNL